VDSPTAISALPTVIKNRSPESIPLPISLVVFLNALLWALYGILVVDDRSLWLPNLVGSFVSFLQILIHAAFYFGLIPKGEAGEGVKVASL
jgi:uncharacterized protein with PQ loop repeat